MTGSSVQEKAIEICFPDNNAFALPCDLNNPDEVACFRKDNPHIKSTVIPPGTPYILRREIGENSRPWQELRPDLSDTFTRLNNLDAETRRNIANMNKSFGSELLVALSEFHRVEIAPLVLRTKEYAKDKVWKTVNKESGGLVGAGVGALDNRLTNFNKVVLESQRALEEVRKGYQAKIPKLELYKLEQTARELLREMKHNFQAELTKYMGNARASARGTVWSNPDRAIAIAKSGRTATPIQLSNAKEMQRVKEFGMVGKLAGPGLLILDIGVRVGNVHVDQMSGLDWQRRAVVETTGLGTAGFLGTAGVYAGGAVGTAAISALNVALLATPVGWCVVIGSGLALGYLAAKGGDTAGQWLAGLFYDASASIKWNRLF
ncbi:hypothetical protein [Thalassomonas haliotis]|uniref:Channel forming colicins domain-containing protein n=1 Tax=Thalassomonas haliotis TaxID=485448 RepID=A0ABY7VEJ0_9GAMM|nr:hypothetical protein [Thalassomonas haliotis]WDE11850.1 hypothetical protein H3N35_27300 [Thalassomonas haliotis]